MLRKSYPIFIWRQPYFYSIQEEKNIVPEKYAGQATESKVFYVGGLRMRQLNHSRQK